MAARALNAAEIRRLVDATVGERPLPFVYFLDTTEPPAWRATAFLLRHRAGGFLAILPADDQVAEQLAVLADEGSPTPLLYTEADLPAETPRRRSVGPVGAFIVDASWASLHLFRRATSRAAGAQLLPTVAMTGPDGQVVRPISETAHQAADIWIRGATSGEAAPPAAELAEYLTAESQLGDGEDEADERAAGAEGEQVVDQVSQLQARIRELEQANARHPAVVPQEPARRGARDLFPDPGPGAALPTLDASAWAALRAAAGAAPPHLARHERAPRAEASHVSDNLLAELELGATEDALGSPPSTMALHRLLLAQTQLLTQLAQSKEKDPISSALSGAKEDTGLGGRGSAARDAFTRLLTDDQTVANAIRRLGAESLGLDVEHPPSNLMRQFAEKKLPSADLKLVTLVARMAAHAWQVGRETQNVALEAWMSRLLLFLEQTAVEQGRTQLSWLLTGLPEPNYSALARRRSGVRPFAQLCPSTWITANVAYLKEMEWVQNRLTAGPATFDPGASDSRTPFTGAKEQRTDEATPGAKKPPRRPPRNPRGGTEGST